MFPGPDLTHGRRALLASSIAVLTLILGAVLIPAASGPDRSAGPAAAVTGAGNDTHTPFNVVSMPALISHRYVVSRLRFTGTSAPGRGFVRRAIGYRSGALDLTGTLVVPNHPRAGGAPLVVSVHGWREPGQYTRGSGLVREENALARAGFAVLHPDLRNHGGSTLERGSAGPDRVGYPADVIAAVLALRKTGLAGIDLTGIGLLGRSMGGGVALQAAIARPDLFDAVELYSPVSSRASDNFTRFANWSPGLRARVHRAYGTPATNPAYWSQISARSYVDRLDMPVRVHHGTRDRITPPSWSRADVTAMRARGVDARLRLWPGQGHRFGSAWPAFSRETIRFFETELR